MPQPDVSCWYLCVAVVLEDLGMLWSSRDYARTRQFFDDALALARRINNDSLVSHSLNRVGNWYLNDDKPARATRFHNEALQIFQAQGDIHGAAQTRDLLGMDHLILGDMVMSEHFFRQAIDDFAALGDRAGLCSTLASYAATAGSDGFEHEAPAHVDRATVEDAMQSALSLSVAIGWRAGEAYARCAIGAYQVVHGNYGLALDSLQRANLIATEIEHRGWAAYALDSLGSVYVGLLDYDRANQLSVRALDLAQAVGSRVHQRGALASLATIHIEQGDVPGAIGLLETVVSRRRTPESTVERWCLAIRAAAALKTGEADLALDIIDKLIQTAPSASRSRPSPQVSKLHGQAFAALGRLPEAEAALTAAEAMATDLGYLPVLWRITLSLGALYKQWGRPEDASRCFDAASATIDRLAGTVTDADLRACFMHSASGVIQAARDQPRSSRRGSVGLTPRQCDVAIHIANGCSNASIANQLHISVRTVEGHISGIMTTLDFASRAQIAAWAVRRGLVDI
ncbi:hypothetical protein BH23CHL1_BH23CHL1_22990 [soil metagenome]